MALANLNPLETADQKRIRLAKEMIDKARGHKKEEEEDDFFMGGGVHYDDEDAVTKTLQLDHVKRKYLQPCIYDD